jgi:hypothetical protein
MTIRSHCATTLKGGHRSGRAHRAILSPRKRRLEPRIERLALNRDEPGRWLRPVQPQHRKLRGPDLRFVACATPAPTAGTVSPLKLVRRQRGLDFQMQLPLKQ